MQYSQHFNWLMAPNVSRNTYSSIAIYIYDDFIKTFNWGRYILLDHISNVLIIIASTVNDQLLIIEHTIKRTISNLVSTKFFVPKFNE